MDRSAGAGEDAHIFWGRIKKFSPSRLLLLSHDEGKLPTARINNSKHSALSCGIWTACRCVVSWSARGCRTRLLHNRFCSSSTTRSCIKNIYVCDSYQRNVMLISSRFLFGARLASRAVSASARSFSDARHSRVMLTQKRGMDIIQDPDLNKVPRFSAPAS